MSDRHAGYIVTLEREIRDENAKATIDAIMQIKGVLNVSPVVGNPDIHIAKISAEMDIKLKVMDALKRVFNPEKDRE